MAFQPQPTRAGWLTLGAATLLAALAVYLLNLVSQAESPPQFFQAFVGLLITLGLLLAAIYWAAAAFRLSYQLNRNGLIIQWGFTEQFIPFENILKIVPGDTVTAAPTFRGINLAGLRLGRGQLPDFPPLRYRTTAPLAQSVLVVSPVSTYVISPQQPQKFIKAWQARQTLGPTQHWKEGISRRWPFDSPLVSDALALWLLALGALLLLALLGFIALSYPALPAALPIHFDSLGRADRIAPKMFLFTLPIAGAVVWALNLLFGGFVYRRERVGAYLLWGSSVITMIGLWVALFTITGS